MKRTQIAIVPILLLLTVIGCSDSPDMRDQRLAEFAEQAVKEQARQNDRMADQSQAVVEESHQLAETAKELVEHDAEARRELIAAQQELTTQLNDLPPEPIAISFLVAVREISKRSLTT